jgi:hypothetical protein
MKNKAHSFAFLVVGASLSGLACAADKAVPANCSGKSCTATVTVASCDKIQVTPDPIVVAKGARPVMRWTLATPGWSFTDNGIDILKHGGEFDGKAKESGTAFKWNNKNKLPGKYKYDVNVTDGKQACRLDPTIVNQ